MDQSGNIYGTVRGGDEFGGWDGLVFKLAPDGAYTVLHRFPPAESFVNRKADGSVPGSGLALDSQGNLYGTTRFGGAHNRGTIFKLAPDGSYSILHSFQGAARGAHPYAGVVIDSAGNLYGTTHDAGRYGVGTIFKLAP